MRLYVRRFIPILNAGQTCRCLSTAPKPSVTEVEPKPSVPKVEQKVSKELDLQTKIEHTKSITNKDMKWRSTWHEKEGQHYSFLRTFYSEDNNTNVMKFLQSPINLSPSAIKNWWIKRRERTNALLQQYVPERNQTLGNELAAAHFIVHRGGAVKFFGEDKWIKANEHNQYELPRFYQDDKILQAIDCTDMNFYYEGLANLRHLKQMEWLCIRYCKEMDDWCLDQISNMFRETLLYLDIRNCPRITENGLVSLCKMDNLKILYVDDMLYTKAFELTCLMLQEVNPDLDIRCDQS